jgi:hypothetical protein
VVGDLFLAGRDIFISHRVQTDSKEHPMRARGNAAWDQFPADERVYRMLRRVAHLRNDVSKERITSIIRVTRIGELVTTLAHQFLSP